jgi:hypothetical protein
MQPPRSPTSICSLFLGLDSDGTWPFFDHFFWVENFLWENIFFQFSIAKKGEFNKKS